MRALVFGDSITQGFWDPEGGWVNAIRKYYDLQNISGEDKNAPTIFNLGISGDTSTDILARFQSETENRKWPGEEFAIVFSVGVNDSYIKSGENIMDIEQYLQNLSMLLDLARKYTTKVVFVGLTPCVEGRTNPVAWDKDIAYSYSRLEGFNDGLRNFCIENKVDFVDILKPMTDKQTQTELLPDGVHPNHEGHKFIAELIQPQLDNILKN